MTLLNILSLDKLKKGNQCTVWEVIHDWVDFDRSNRLTYLKRLFKEYLQFDHLTKDFVEDNIFQSIIFRLLPIDFQKELKAFAKNAKLQDEQNNQMPTSDVNNFRPLKTPLLLVSIDRFNGSVEWYDHQRSSWHLSPLSFILPTNEFYFELVTVDGRSLYAFGGCDGYEDATNKVWSRSLSQPQSEWTEMRPMNQRRRNLCSVVLYGAIYALGGFFKGADLKLHTLRSCERYDSRQNCWSAIAPLRIGRGAAAAAIHNDCIYIAGGENEEVRAERSVERYQLLHSSHSWSFVALMTTARFGFALVTYAGRLWAIGGSGDEGAQSGEQTLLSSVESYDPVTDSWQEEASLNEGRFGHSAINFNGEMVVVGGCGTVLIKGKNFCYYYKLLTKDTICFFTECGKKRKIKVPYPIKAVERYVPGRGWIKSNTLQKNHFYPKMIIIPSSSSNITSYGL